MNPYLQACLPDQRMSKSTLLAMLNSQLDTSKVIVVATGEVIDVSQMAQTDINPHLNNGSWVYYEENQPRRMLLTNPQWQITSFNPRSRQVCVQIFAPSGMRVLSFTLQPLTASSRY